MKLYKKNLGGPRNYGQVLSYIYIHFTALRLKKDEIYLITGAPTRRTLYDILGALVWFIVLYLHPLNFHFQLVQI